MTKGGGTVIELLWADVPWPLYDDWQAVIVLPLSMLGSSAAAAVGALLDERRGSRVLETRPEVDPLAG